MKYTLSKWQWYRKLKGGIWYYVRPYDNLYSFQHIRYWIDRNPFYNEVIEGREIHKTNQSTFVFCPKCKIEMVSNNYCVKDDDLVYYECGNCGNKSEWDFDLAPVPILMRSDDGRSDLASKMPSSRPNMLNGVMADEGSNTIPITYHHDTSKPISRKET